jgi:putative pyruvate formate lyase activating enzyme
MSRFSPGEPEKIPASFSMLEDCTLCPRQCHVNRLQGQKGYCKTGSAYPVASVCIHRGEEPPISGDKGICNVFFSHCNLQCIYCQNNQISNNNTDHLHEDSGPGGLVSRITAILDQGIPSLGFVSPTHVTPQMIEVIRVLHELGRKPFIVYNSNGYDCPETLRKLEGLVDIYLPDFKYASGEDAAEFSDAPDYFASAVKSVKEMYYQKGSPVIINERGYAESGLIIRHLVLPERTAESIRVLETIAEELSLSVHISLMSQYYPAGQVLQHPVLGKKVSRQEYEKVTDAMEKMGFRNGWAQGYDSPQSYRPDFRRLHPFEP